MSCKLTINNFKFDTLSEVNSLEDNYLENKLEEISYKIKNPSYIHKLKEKYEKLKIKGSFDDFVEFNILLEEGLIPDQYGNFEKNQDFSIERFTDYLSAKYNQEIPEKNIEDKYKTKQYYQNYDDIELNDENVFDYESFSRVKELTEDLKKVFDVEVIIDNFNFKENEAGVLLPDNHPLSIREGKKVIAINSKYFNTKTVFHEFSHVIIDGLGGLNNKRIKAAVDKLRETELWGRIEEIYEDNNIEKEVLATAIGLRAEQIFKEDLDKSWWQKFIEWFFTRIKTLFGFYDVETLAQALAKKIKLNLENTTNTEEYQYSILWKSKFKEDEIINQKIKTIDKFKEASIKMLSKKIDYFKNKKLTEFFSELQKIQLELSKIDDILSESALYNIVSVSIEFLKKSEELLKSSSYNLSDDKLKELLLKGELSSEDSQMIEKYTNLIYDVKMFLSAFEFMDELNEIINYNDIQLEENTRKTLESYVYIKNSLKDLNNKISINLQAFKLAMKHDIVSYLLNNPNIPEERKKEFKEKIKENPNYLKVENYERWKEEFIQGLDISKMEEYVNNKSEIKSFTVQVVKKILDNIDLKKTEALQKILNEFREKFEEYKKKVGKKSIGNPEKFFEPFLEVIDGKKTGFLISEFYSFVVKDLEKAGAERKIALKNFLTILKSKGEIKNKELKKIKSLAISLAEINISISELTYEYKNNSISDEEYLPLRKNLTKQKSLIYRNIYKELNKLFKDIDNLQEDEELIESIKYLNEKRNKYDELKKEYLNEVVTEEGIKYYIKEKYRNPMFSALTPEQRELYDYIVDKFIDADILKNKKEKLTSAMFNSGPVVELPTLERNAIERISSYGIKKFIVEEVKDIYKQRPSDVEISPSREIYKNEINEDIPIFYRGEKTQDQSYDIFTLMFLELENSLNYKLKKNIMIDLEIIKDIIRNKDYVKVNQVGSIVKGSFLKEPLSYKGINSSEYKTIERIIEQRLYGLGMHPSFLNKASTTITKITAATYHALNFFAAIPNFIIGKINSFIDVYAYSKTKGWDKKIGEKLYFADLKNIMNDIGKISFNSKTNILMQYFNIFDDFKISEVRFSKDTKLKKIYNKIPFSLTSMGEHAITGAQMYYILGNIKVKDRDGDYIDKDGNKVDSRDKAASVYDMIYIEDGTVKFKDFEYIEESKNKFDPVFLRNFIKKHIVDAQGLYTKDWIAEYQRYWWGIPVALFRKWVEPGVMRRFRGLYNFVVTRNINPEEQEDLFLPSTYSMDLEMDKEGYYVSFIRFLHEARKIQKENNEKFFIKGKNFKEAFNKLSIEQKENIYRFAFEFLMSALSLAAFIALREIRKGIDDEDEELKEFVYFVSYLSRRVHTELSFYYKPTEFIKIMNNPSAVIAYVNDLFRLGETIIAVVIPYIDNDVNIFFGAPKLDEKLKKRFLKVTPYAYQIYRTANFEESLDNIFSYFRM